ncbi:MAG: RlmE family RNA methyltransferase [Gammaproteobacteria bacterium]|nr:RlmE family RNA methyltransferase [Gammaproteobacteria bacterium]
MAVRSKSSKRWLREHFSDASVREAQALGYRSRAVVKLRELDERYRLFKSGMRVLDLGAAPGSWSQYAAERVLPAGRVVASDLLEFAPLDGVQRVIGDFTEAPVAERIKALVGSRGADLVMSDMAPNMSGQRGVDQPRAMYLAELALEMAEMVLCESGCFVSKLFQGEGSDVFIERMRASFLRVAVRKPPASRPRSREIYALAWNLKL